MYKVYKDYGVSENVFLRNTDTMAEINLGGPTMKMMEILEKDGYKFSLIHPSDDITGCITIKEKWELKVNDDVKKELEKLTMPMKKPIRDQRKHKETDDKQIVDVLDIIYGLA